MAVQQWPSAVRYPKRNALACRSSSKTQTSSVAQAARYCPVWLHGYRRANAALMDTLNAPVKIRQQRLGHTDSRVTLATYTHVGADECRLARPLGEISLRSKAQHKKSYRVRQPTPISP